VIQIEGLTKQYGATTVVDAVSFNIERNSIAVIVGTSGSGKSTLLRMINRLVEPTAGRVLLDGADTRSEPAHLLRRRIGYAIQGHGLFPHRTVAEYRSSSRSSSSIRGSTRALYLTSSPEVSSSAWASRGHSPRSLVYS